MILSVAKQFTNITFATLIEWDKVKKRFTSKHIKNWLRGRGRKERERKERSWTSKKKETYKDFFLFVKSFFSKEIGIRN
ncbi:hypothetical protein BpHYR1_028125 [Brachionus plicatilis]|uniref:Uncharacterized protein n=1 Tax=Brachionus plicatilis TaxID=10195 RepID=A0A3M7SLV1_BRAPC|nr:hypothetical protein BpHYR1_028125 [Brachionus plicatilis]